MMLSEDFPLTCHTSRPPGGCYGQFRQFRHIGLIPPSTRPQFALNWARTNNSMLIQFFIKYIIRYVVKKGSEFPIYKPSNTPHFLPIITKPNHPVQQKHIKITANPNVPTLLVWLRCLFTLRQGWIGLWIGKIRMGSDCFEFSDFRRKPFWAGAWWKYECGNGPFPQISFYSQTLRFVKSDKNKFLITPRAWQYINSTSCERMLEHRFSSSLCWMML